MKTVEISIKVYFDFGILGRLIHYVELHIEFRN